MSTSPAGTGIEGRSAVRVSRSLIRTVCWNLAGSGRAGERHPTGVAPWLDSHHHGGGSTGGDDDQHGGICGLSAGSVRPEAVARVVPDRHDDRHMRVSGTLAFVDISGFTRLTERLARKGKVGAEEMSDILDATFAGAARRGPRPMAPTWSSGAATPCCCSSRARTTRCGRPVGVPDAGHACARSAGSRRRRATVTLRMSVGIHSGDFDFFLVGDPVIHRELLISGPGGQPSPRTWRRRPRPVRSGSAPRPPRC